MKADEQISDAALIKAWQSGDSGAFDRLLRRYQAPLFAYLYRRTGDRATAEDLFQETFMRVIRALPGYQERARFASWLFGIAWRLVIDHHRHKTGSHTNNSAVDIELVACPEDEAGSWSPHARVESEEFSRLIDDAMGKMPDECREIFLLRQHGELTFREIAALVDRPLNTVLGQMRRALLYLRQKIGKQYV
jgi:RNA polymerase sigma-70 factor, ECF subfamily